MGTKIRGRFSMMWKLTLVVLAMAVVAASMPVENEQAMLGEAKATPTTDAAAPSTEEQDAKNADAKKDEAAAAKKDDKAAADTKAETKATEKEAEKERSTSTLSFRGTWLVTMQQKTTRLMQPTQRMP